MKTFRKIVIVVASILGVLLLVTALGMQLTAHVSLDSLQHVQLVSNRYTRLLLVLRIVIYTGVFIFWNAFIAYIGKKFKWNGQRVREVQMQRYHYLIGAVFIEGILQYD